MCVWFLFFLFVVVFVFVVGNSTPFCQNNLHSDYFCCYHSKIDTHKEKKKTKYRNPKLCMIHNFHSAQSSGICIAVPTTTEQRTTILKCNFLNRIAYWKNSVLKTKFCYATQHHLTQTKIARRKWKETLKLPQKLCVMTRENKFWLCDADAAVSVAPKNQLSRRSLYFASRGQSSTSIVVSSTSNNKHTHTHNCRPIHRLPLLVQPK